MTSNNMSDTQCAVCLDPVALGQSAHATLPCHGYSIHRACLAEWQKHNQSCPICRVATVCSWCLAPKTELAILGCVNDAGQKCNDHPICAGCADNARERNACIRCCPTNIPRWFLTEKIDLVLDYLERPANIEHSIRLGNGVDRSFTHTEKYLIAVITLRERPARHWAYVESQLDRYQSFARLRLDTTSSASDRTRSALIALYNYAVNVLNSLPCRPTPRIAGHLLLAETLTKDGLLREFVKTYTHANINLLRQLVSNVAALVGNLPALAN
jgi:hypothetical protein